jgi:hypothetical protein
VPPQGGGCHRLVERTKCTASPQQLYGQSSWTTLLRWCPGARRRRLDGACAPARASGHSGVDVARSPTHTPVVPLPLCDTLPAGRTSRREVVYHPGCVARRGARTAKRVGLTAALWCGGHVVGVAMPAPPDACLPRKRATQRTRSVRSMVLIPPPERARSHVQVFVADAST